MRFKIDWASLTVAGKFTVFALFYFVFEDNFQIHTEYKPRGGLLYLEGRFNGGFLALRVWGAYFWSFTVLFQSKPISLATFSFVHVLSKRRCDC